MSPLAIRVHGEYREIPGCGVDSSNEMLGHAALAHDAAESSVRERVSFVKGDMRDAPGSGGAFDAVVIACCSVSHLLTLDDRRRTWATAFRLLRPGGVFVLDVRVPDLATLAESQRVQPRAFVDLDIDTNRRSLGEEARLLRCTATTDEPHLQRADVRLIYDRFEQRALAERLVSDFASHVYFPAERELLFVAAGFEIVRQYGDYRFVPCDRTSQYVVTVARRPRHSARRTFRRDLHVTTHHPIRSMAIKPPTQDSGPTEHEGRGSHDTRQHRRSRRIDQS
jgi:SAM-dependent methyltransferase